MRHLLNTLYVMTEEAWLSLDGENTKSNIIKGCYFQYTDSEIIIGNGTTVDLKDYLLKLLQPKLH